MDSLKPYKWAKPRENERERIKSNNTDRLIGNEPVAKQNHKININECKNVKKPSHYCKYTSISMNIRLDHVLEEFLLLFVVL